jgi:hypothetical protein
LFQSKQAGGTWVARKVFTKRIPRTVSFVIDGDEFDLDEPPVSQNAGQKK